MKVYDCDNQQQFDQLNNKIGDIYHGSSYVTCSVSLFY